MATSAYARGAKFEREVITYLMGKTNKDGKIVTNSYLDSLASAVQSEYPDVKVPTLYAVRAAGSKGPLDLIIVGSYTHKHQHLVLGIQCKTYHLSQKKIDKDLTQIYKDHKIMGVYATRRVGKTPEFYPDLTEVFTKLLLECSN